MRYALDIIKKWQFNFPILKYVTGKSGYNVKIRKLLDQIDREVKVFDKDSFDNIYNPLYTMGSSKLCRKTHLDNCSTGFCTSLTPSLYVFSSRLRGMDQKPFPYFDGATGA